MSDTAPAAPLPLAAAPPRIRRVVPWRVFAQAFGIVTGFWWLATGLVIAAQHPVARGASIAAAALLAVAGAVLVARSRADATPAGARRALAGAGLLWTWVAVSLYAGWLIGPAPRRPAAAPPNLAAAVDAVHALLWHELGSLAVVALAFALTFRGPNRAAFHVLLAFWGTTQLAKLNVFVGVANPGERFLPEWLRFVAWYFGPERNSVLLPVSVAVLTVAAVWLARRAAGRADPFERWAGATVACMLALGALEHVFLGLAWNAPLWDAFLKVRG